MNTKGNVLMTVLAISALVSSAGAHASFIGSEMEAVYYYPDTSTPYGSATTTPTSFVVGTGQEAAIDVEGVTTLLIDFSADALSLTFNTTLPAPTWGNASFNGPIFTAVAPLNLAGATVNTSTTMSGFDNSRVSFTNDQILLNWQGLSYTEGTQVNVDFAFNPTAEVPEPGSLGLFGMAALGLLGVGLWRRREQHHAIGARER